MANTEIYHDEGPHHTMLMHENVRRELDRLFPTDGPPQTLVECVCEWYDNQEQFLEIASA